MISIIAIRRRKPSIHFYKSLGAEAMSDWTVYRITGETLKKLGRDLQDAAL